MILLLLVTGSFICYAYETKDLAAVEKYTEGDDVWFSFGSGFYTEDISLHLGKARSYPFLAQLRYTMDGSEPTETSPRYDGPLLLAAREQEQVYTIRAAVFYKGEKSRTYTRTYLLGKGVAGRYHMPVISIAAEPEDLYGAEQGLFVEGQTFAEYQEENPGEDEGSYLHLANYHQRDWTRRVHTTIFDQQGNCLISQGTGLYLGGYGSRENEQKTLNLEADRIYDEENTRFRYRFWEQDSGAGQVLPEPESYNKIKLRNGGQDYSETLLRDEVTAELARSAGLHDTKKTRPAVVYINNRYYGILYMQPIYSNSYIGARYGLDKQQIEVAEDGEGDLLKAAGISEEQKDVTVSENRALFEERIDMEQLLLYYAVEIIIGNCDWPQNNLKAWRYNGPEIEGNPYSDGRFRMLFYDADRSYSLKNEDSEIFSFLLYNGKETSEHWNLFYHLMEYQPYRQMFVANICDLLTDTFQTKHVLETITAANQKLIREFPYLQRDTPFASVKKMIAGRNEKVDQLLYYAGEREQEVLNYLEHYFEAGSAERYKLTIEAPERGSSILLNSLTADGGGEGISTFRYRNYPAKITAGIGPGQEFEHWLLNGQRITQRTLILDPELIDTDEAVVELVTKRTAEEVLLINKVGAKGSEDFLELVNAGTKPVDLSGYYLSDDRGDLAKYQCPELLLKPSETVIIYAKNNPVMEAYLCNFNLKAGETLYLSNGGGVTDHIEIPDMGAGDYYGRYLCGNEFRFYSRADL